MIRDKVIREPAPFAVTVGDIVLLRPALNRWQRITHGTDHPHAPMSTEPAHFPEILKILV